MGKYIILVEDEPWKTINGVWALVKRGSFIFESVYILGEEKAIEKVKDDISTILDQYGIDGEAVSLIFEESPGEEIEDIFDGEEEEIALDISGASKSLVAEILVHPMSKNFDHIYCLQSLEKKELDVPYPILDRARVVLEDLIGGEKE